jgi:hypothetical protein
LALVGSATYPGRCSNSIGLRPLFFPDEVAKLFEPPTQARSVAGPGDDIVLDSTARRDGGVMIAPLAITGRRLVQGNALHLIVHDARLDFVNADMGSRITPTFTFGSRSQASLSTIQTVPGARCDGATCPDLASTRCGSCQQSRTAARQVETPS